MKARRVIRLDRERLEQLAGVKFGDEGFAQLVELTTILAERFREPDMPDFMLDDAWKERWHQQPRQVEMDVRRWFVEAVTDVWHECGGRGVGSYHDKGKTEHTGRLNCLLQELLRAANIGGPAPSATLHHDIEFLHTGRERQRRQKTRN